MSGESKMCAYDCGATTATPTATEGKTETVQNTFPKVEDVTQQIRACDNTIRVRPTDQEVVVFDTALPVSEMILRLHECGDLTKSMTVEAVSSAEKVKTRKKEEEEVARVKMAKMVYEKMGLDRLLPPQCRLMPIHVKAQLIQKLRQLLIENGLSSISNELVRMMVRKLFHQKEITVITKLIVAERLAPVDLEHETRNRTRLFYQESNYRAVISDCIETLPFTGYIDLKSHVDTIAAWFPPACGVLEVAAGNGYTSLFIRNALKRRSMSGALLSSYVATDLFEPKQRYFSPYEHDISSDAAVRKYYGQFNVLIMVAPPCNVWVDYYAIKTLELMHDAALKDVLPNNDCNTPVSLSSSSSSSLSTSSSSSSSLSTSSSLVSSPSLSGLLSVSLGHTTTSSTSLSSSVSLPAPETSPIATSLDAASVTAIPTITAPQVYDYSRATKYCLFVGELGASEGGRGMYHYMHGGSRWQVRHTLKIESNTDMYGAISQRDAFFFEYIDT
jgi:hypothetical protein